MGVPPHFINVCTLKTLERLVLWHIEETNLTDRPMHKSQYGFREGKSTDQALSMAVNIIEKGLN
jgi:hypothetical protein